jgi:hypothetical protein
MARISPSRESQKSIVSRPDRLRPSCKVVSRSFQACSVCSWCLNHARRPFRDFFHLGTKPFSPISSNFGNYPSQFSSCHPLTRGHVTLMMRPPSQGVAFVTPLICDPLIKGSQPHIKGLYGQNLAKSKISKIETCCLRLTPVDL